MGTVVSDIGVCGKMTTNGLNCYSKPGVVVLAARVLNWVRD